MIFHLFQRRKTFFDIIYNFDFLRTIFYFGIDVYEHTFDIDENITVEEFQSLLDNAKNIIVETINKIENDEV